MDRNRVLRMVTLPAEYPSEFARGVKTEITWSTGGDLNIIIGRFRFKMGNQWIMHHRSSRFYSSLYSQCSVHFHLN